MNGLRRGPLGSIEAIRSAIAEQRMRPPAPAPVAATQLPSPWVRARCVGPRHCRLYQPTANGMRVVGYIGPGQFFDVDPSRLRGLGLIPVRYAGIEGWTDSTGIQLVG